MAGVAPHGRGPIALSGPDRAPIAPSGPDRAPIAPSGPDRAPIAPSGTRSFALQGGILSNTGGKDGPDSGRVWCCWGYRPSLFPLANYLGLLRGRL